MYNFMQLLVGIMSALPTLIQTAETAFSGHPGSGKAKKELVMASTATILGMASQAKPGLLTQDQADDILGSVSVLTDSTVAIINSVKKPAQPVEVPPNVIP